jgi:hypothetical protein
MLSFAFDVKVPTVQYSVVEPKIFLSAQAPVPAPDSFIRYLENERPIF